jgi:hypothetical protein
MLPHFKITIGVLVVLAIVLLLAAMYGGYSKPPENEPIPEGAGPDFHVVGHTGFRERAREAGLAFHMHFLPNEQGEKFKINLYDHGSGVAVGDYDGDGRDDIYFLNQLGPNALFRNQGDGTFVDVSAEAGVALGDRVCVGATFADYDNDGRQDLFVTSTRGGNVLFKNLGNGKFKDVTKEAGLAHVGHSQTAAFFDYDNDGYLDLIVTNTARWTRDQFDEAARYYPGKEDLLLELAGSAPEYNILYHNNRDGTFTDVTEKAGLKGKGWSGDVAIFDYDGDGYLDLVVTNMFGASQLFQNNRDGTFTDVTRRVLKRTPWGGMGARAFDFNNDGRLDLYIVDMHSDMWMGLLYDWPQELVDVIKRGESRKYPYVTGPVLYYRKELRDAEQKKARRLKINYEEVVFGNTFYKNLGNGTFEEISDQAGLETLWPWGIVTGDFDNDGYEDVFLPSGMGFPFFYWPNYLLMNNGDGTFTDRARVEGIEPPPRGIYQDEKLAGRLAARSSRSAAVADFSNTGRLDIVVNNFNDAPYFYGNTFRSTPFIQFRLQGTRSNRDAIGAVVRLHTGQEVMTRMMQAAGGYLSQSSKVLHFGLGSRPGVDRVEITWPSGIHQIIQQPRLNIRHEIVEPAEAKKTP